MDLRMWACARKAEPNRAVGALQIRRCGPEVLGRSDFSSTVRFTALSFLLNAVLGQYPN